MADIVFAFDPAVDHPCVPPSGCPTAVAERIGKATLGPLETAAQAAIDQHAGALVVCGRVLDPLRASPAQAAGLRDLIDMLRADGCQTIWACDDRDHALLSFRMVGEPEGLSMVAPGMAWSGDIRGVAFELAVISSAVVSPTGLPAADLPALHRRILLGWDRSGWETGRHRLAEPTGLSIQRAASLQAQRTDTICLWGSRTAGAGLPSGVRHLPPLQARAADEPTAGSCLAYGLPRGDSVGGDGMVSRPSLWQELPTHAFAWKTVRVESPAGDHEELADELWAAIESAPGDRPPLTIAQGVIACGTNVERRVRIGEIAAETVARLREQSDRGAHRDMVWWESVAADVTESLAPLGHLRSGGRPGATSSFTSALADIASDREQSSADDPGLVREAAWLALELVTAD